jgi:hypothetical protein
VNVHDLNDDELDLLADFTAGALDPADHDRVARLIATDRRWATAHVALTRAEQSVRSDLRSIAGPIAMPSDVVARLGPTLVAPDRFISSRSRADRPVLAMPTQRTTTRRTDRRQSRWRRAGLAVVGVAAAAAIAGGIGVVTNSLHGSSSTASGANGPGADAAPPGRAAAPNLPGGPVTLNSGRNYQPGTLDQLANSYRAVPPNAPLPSPGSSPVPAPAAGANQSSSSKDSAQVAPQAGSGGASGDLSRLASPDALRECLAAVALAHPGTPTVVDFAAFEGAPAVVIVIRKQPTGAVVVVVGPACGISGADERYVTTVN